MANPVIHLDIICYKEEDLFVAHCLQLDLVTTAMSVPQAYTDMEELIKTHITYAIQNNNLDNLFKPAPPDIWRLVPKASVVDDKPVKEVLLPSIPPPHLIFQIQRLCA